jgi:L-alanine-DL-glutamate epimerase-like enolase superfamily enzyme
VAVRDDRIDSAGGDTVAELVAVELLVHHDPLRVTRLETFLTNAGLRNYLFVRLTADGGLTGLGEASLEWQEKTVETILHEWVESRILGRDPFDIEAWYAENTLGSYLASGVEMAMWDLMGKALNQPLYRLLGGAVRKKIELAACMGIKPYEEAKAIARSYVDMGFTTLKTKAGRDQFRGDACSRLRGSVLQRRDVVLGGGFHLPQRRGGGPLRHPGVAGRRGGAH